MGLRSQIAIRHPDPKNRERTSTVWVRDISARGIGIVSPLRLRFGLEFIASFPRHNQTPLSLLYRITDCRLLSGNLYALGAQLLRQVEC